MELAFVKGFAVAAALIVAIGAQNAFVLRQGLKREHVLAVVLVCALSELLLVGLGVAGVGTLVAASPALMAAARWGGALFLVVYGAGAARRALADHRLTAGAGEALGLRSAVLAALGFTYLNPHCWLDTVVLIGSISGQQTDALRPWFAAGACSAGVVWFFALGYGARLLAPLFARPAAWRVLDGGIAAVMWGLAVSLLVR